MPGLWETARKAAVSGAARAAVTADNAVRRLECQRRIAAQQATIEARYAALGRLLAAEVRAGRASPAGSGEHLGAIDAAEGEIERLRAEIRTYGG